METKRVILPLSLARWKARERVVLEIEREIGGWARRPAEEFVTHARVNFPSAATELRS